MAVDELEGKFRDNQDIFWKLFWDTYRLLLA